MLDSAPLFSFNWQPLVAITEIALIIITAVAVVQLILAALHRSDEARDFSAARYAIIGFVAISAAYLLFSWLNDRSEEPMPSQTAEQTATEPEPPKKEADYRDGRIDCANLPPNTAIVAIGDSNTESTESYADFIKSACPNLRVLKYGFSGKSAEFIYRKTVAKHNSRDYGATHVVVFAGVNNITGAVAGLKKIYDKARKDGLTVIGVTITPWAGYGVYSTSDSYQRKTDEVNAWIRANADIVIDVYDDFEDPDRENHLFSAVARDAIHLNKVGQSALGHRIIERTFQ